VLDLLYIRDLDRISQFEREGDIDLGNLFSFPFQTIESILPLEDGRLLPLNDNNYPLSAGRNPDEPNDTEAIIIPARRPSQLASDQADARHRRASLLVSFGSALPVASALGAIVLRRARPSSSKSHA
jgi:hypothetical protein